jgi:hypothetical protein
MIDRVLAWKFILGKNIKFFEPEFLNIVDFVHYFDAGLCRGGYAEVAQREGGEPIR